MQNMESKKIEYINYSIMLDEAYKEYYTWWVSRLYQPMEFRAKIKEDPEFANRYGIEIKVDEISLAERRKMVTQEMFNQIYNAGGPETLSHSEINQWKIPKHKVTLKYKGEEITVYE